MREETTLIREVAISYRGARRRVATPLRSPADAARFVRGIVSDDAREHFLAIYLVEDKAFKLDLQHVR